MQRVGRTNLSAGIPKEAAIVMHEAEAHKMRSWRRLSVARVESRRAAVEDKGSWCDHKAVTFTLFSIFPVSDSETYNVSDKSLEIAEV